MAGRTPGDNLPQNTTEVNHKMETTQQNPPSIRKAFFGKGTCLILHANAEAKKVFLAIGKKASGSWTWAKAKISDEEMGDILLVLERNAQDASFYHEYQGKQNKIWVNRKGDNVYFRIEEQSKALSPTQQTIMAVLLRHAILVAAIGSEAWRQDSRPQAQTQTIP